ncbi:hypothetical protein TWF730_001865 [Orbilia blumenaviensis]|uniref:Uncharacterized protein n=1 Tax=Orbilia blumenaviensis TaxID=1796055 RepID=A0AAV9UC99_9PEZI
MLDILKGPFRMVRWNIGAVIFEPISALILHGLFENHSANLCVLELSFFFPNEEDKTECFLNICKLPSGGLPLLRKLHATQVATPRGFVQLHYILGACVVLEEFGFELHASVSGDLDFSRDDVSMFPKEDVLSELDDFGWTSDTWGELLLKGVFQNLQRFELKLLRICQVYDLTKDMAAYLKIEHLRHLHLLDCWTLDSFFEGLQAEKMELHTLKITDSQFTDDYAILFDFLDNLRPGLQELVCAFKQYNGAGMGSLLRARDLPSGFVNRQGQYLEKMTLIWTESPEDLATPMNFGFQIPRGLVKLKQICLPAHLIKAKPPSHKAGWGRGGPSRSNDSFHVPATQDQLQFHGLPDLHTITFVPVADRRSLEQYFAFLPIKPNNYGFEDDGDGAAQGVWNKLHTNTLKGLMEEVATSYGAWHSVEKLGKPKLKWIIFDPAQGRKPYSQAPRLGYHVKWNANDLPFIKDEYLPQLINVPDIEKVLEAENENIEKISLW